MVPTRAASRRHRRPFALDPAHGESVVICPPANIDTTRSRRERPVFAGVGGEFVEREPDGLRGSGAQPQPGAVRSDPRPQKVRKMRELGAAEILRKPFE
jgi:hypothetical protein